MIARPALAAVTEALAGVTDPGEAVEILVARDLWPASEPEWHHEPPSCAPVLRVASVASLGVEEMVALRALAVERAGDARSVWWMCDRGTDYESQRADVRIGSVAGSAWITVPRIPPWQWERARGE